MTTALHSITLPPAIPYHCACGVTWVRYGDRARGTRGHRETFRIARGTDGWFTCWCQKSRFRWEA